MDDVVTLYGVDNNSSNNNHNDNNNNGSSIGNTKLSNSIKLSEPPQITDKEKRRQMIRKFKTGQITNRSKHSTSGVGVGILTGPGGVSLSQGDSDVNLSFEVDDMRLNGPAKTKPLKLVDPMRQMALQDALTLAKQEAKRNARKKAYVVENFEKRRCYPERQPVVYVGNSD